MRNKETNKGRSSRLSFSLPFRPSSSFVKSFDIELGKLIGLSFGGTSCATRILLQLAVARGFAQRQKLGWVRLRAFESSLKLFRLPNRNYIVNSTLGVCLNSICLDVFFKHVLGTNAKCLTEVLHATLRTPQLERFGA